MNNQSLVGLQKTKSPRKLGARGTETTLGTESAKWLTGKFVTLGLPLLGGKLFCTDVADDPKGGLSLWKVETVSYTRSRILVRKVDFSLLNSSVVVQESQQSVS